MAVEIPVIIDIEGAFQDAAKRVKTAMAPMEKAVEEIDLNPMIYKYTQSLVQARDYAKNLATELKGLMALNEAELFAPIDVSKIERVTNALKDMRAFLNVDQGDKFNQFVEGLSRADFELLQLNEHYRALEESSMRMSDSINGYRARLAELNEQWNRMTAEERKSAEGKALYNKYKAEAEALRETALTLDQKLAKEQAIAKTAQKNAKQQQYENTILNTTAKTIQQLSEQARILNQRLNNAEIGSKQYQNLKQRLEEVRQKMQEVEGSVNGVTTAVKTQQGAMSKLTSMAASYISVFGAMRLVKQIRDVTGEFEYQRVALGHLIQNVEYGNRIFEQLKQNATESPFRVKELVTYTKQLAAYQIPMESLVDTTSRLADISAGLGVDMNRLILAYGQVRAASVLRGQELRQFTEAGIPLVDLLTEKMGELNNTTYTTADIFRLISERAVPFSAIASIFEDLTDKGGMFYDMQKTQAETLKGQWEKLKDVYDIALQRIGDTTEFQVLNKVVLTTAWLTAKSLRYLLPILDLLIAAWITYSIAALRARRADAAVGAEKVKQAAIEEAQILIKRYNIKATKQYTKAIVGQKVAATALGRAFWKLWAAMVANPITAVIAGVAALTVAVLGFLNITKKTTDTFEEYDKAIENLANSQKEFEKNKSLINTYETLAKKTDRSATENARLARTMNSLLDIFPQVALSFSNENDEIERNIKLLNKENDARLQYTRTTAEHTLRAITGKISELDSQINDLQERLESNGEYLAYLDQQDPTTYSGWTNDLSLTSNEVLRLTDELRKLNEERAKYLEYERRIQEYLDPSLAAKRRDEWKRLLLTMKDYTSGSTTYNLFSEQDVDNWHTLYEAGKDLKKMYKDAKESYEGLMEAVRHAKPGTALEELKEEATDAGKRLEALQLIMRTFGFDWWESTGSKGYTADPFIALMNERVKFMQDFQKGYENLRKYMTNSRALEEESRIMLSRGLSLGLSADDQKRAADELSNWYQEAMEEAFQQAKRHGATAHSIEEFLSQQIRDTSNRGKALRDFQKMIQSMWDAKTTYDTTSLTKQIEAELNRIKEEVKRSETVRKFFDDILGLTGDTDIASNLTLSIYGDLGSDFRERIQRELNEAFESLSEDLQTPDLRRAIEDQDFTYLIDQLDMFSPEWQKQIRSMAEATEKYNSDIAKSYGKLLLRFDEMEQQRVNIVNKANKDIADLEAGLALELAGIDADQNIQDKAAAKAAATRRAQAVQAAIESERDLQLSRLTREYRMFFSSVGVISDEAARRVARNQKEIITAQFNAGQKTLAQYKRELAEIDKQLNKYTSNKGLFASYISEGIEGVVGELNELSDALLAISSMAETDENGLFKINEDDKKYINRMGRIFGGQIFGVAGRWNVFDKLFEKTGGDATQMKEAITNASDAIQSMGAAFNQGIGWADLWVKNIGNLIIELNELGNIGQETSEWWDNVANIIMKIPSLGLSKSDAAGDRLAEMNEYAMQGFEKFKSGNFVGALADTIRSWSAMFGPSVKAIDREIKTQSELIEDLEYKYSKLDAVLQHTFGSDYVATFNSQMELLQAQADAYLAQAQLERDKGKKADEDAAKDYEKSARNIQDKIMELRNQIAEFLTGTDLTSAAKDFADAWLDAYKEFGDTAGAIEERMEDMVKNIVSNALMSGIVQSMMGDWFESLKSIEDWNARAIADKVAEARGLIAGVNQALSVAATELQGAGLDLRATASGFTGIARDIAGASEESINGLAAGINAQNFYMSHIDANVSAILAALTGTTSPNPNAAPASGESTQMQLLEYVSSLPLMQSDLSSIRIMLERVIKPIGMTATHYVSARM